MDITESATYTSLDRRDWSRRMNRTIDIVNHEHFRKTLSFAKKQPAKTRATFKRSLQTINRLKRNLKADRVYISPDYVSHSFYWALFRNGDVIYNGGLILHGYEETFSVELNPEKFPHWSIHT